jgi:peptidoglycan L-alanyl-D-glutamate endopeptidase CwlK
MDKLDGLHPDLREKIEKILAAMAALGFPMVVVEGLRSAERQQALYAKGRTAPGNIVTYLDGVKKRSNHQVKADGFGHAVDCAFLKTNAEGQPSVSWDLKNPWKVYGLMAETLGLVWGGKWTKLVDMPHVESPKVIA